VPECLLNHGLQNIVQPTIHVHIDGSRKVMPDKKERDLWWKFLAGLPESDWNPPKKPKKASSKNRFSGHMRAFCDEPEVPHKNVEQNHNESHETWCINSEGDVELAVDESAGALQSVDQPPQIGPVFSASIMETPSVIDPASNHTGHEQHCSPREITPSLLRKIDHVRMEILSYRLLTKSICRTCPFTFSCISLTG